MEGNGNKQFNSLSPEQSVAAGRDRVLAAARLQTRRDESASSQESQDERNDRQEREVEALAKALGVWHEGAIAYARSFGEELPGGQESRVFENCANGTVVKVKNTLQYHDLNEFLDGIILHNMLIHETAYKVLGFGSDGEGFVAILEQPFVRGTEPTQKQIDAYVQSLGFVKDYDGLTGNFKSERVLLRDLHPKNLILTPASNIAIIDAIVRPNQTRK